jgi:hypothetical protein
MYNKIITGLLISVFTVGIASAMDMDTSGSAMIKDDMKTGTMAKDTMMKDSMSGMVATSSDMMMYDKVTATSNRCCQTSNDACRKGLSHDAKTCSLWTLWFTH